MRRQTVFFDFDNTITSYDVLDDMLLRFSKDDRWIGLERRWRNGEIGSKDCLEGQIEGIRITKDALYRYLSKVKLDPYFKRLVKLLDSRKIRTFILSDNFDYIINRILKHNRIRGLKIYSNRARLAGDRLIPYFPFTDKSCWLCAHCKRNNLLANHAGNSTTVYIGDGLSDTCPSEYADMVFAKGNLLKYLKRKNLSHIRYKGLKDIYKYFSCQLDNNSMRNFSKCKVGFMRSFCQPTRFNLRGCRMATA